ncbi:MAG: HAD-IA family hydrolase [Spirochaetia bacterium]|jgi:putative hydrolase of the HAD superfamily|nr:HAD-IA family hydrolase [Spirochaetia bacterium]
MYKAVVFDFGNVLCGLDRMAFARAAAPRSKLSAQELDAALWGDSLEKEHETGRYDSHGFFRRVTELAGFDPSYSYEEFVADYRRIILPNPDGEAGLKTARDLGARCFVLSNTAFLHATMIFENEVLASIPELHILSYKVGLMKPDPRIWLTLLEYAGLAAGDCLYIDDVKAYCEAAEGLGFGTFCYDRNVHSLSQILRGVLK